MTSTVTAVAAETRVFGIRHHGPGSARSLRLALEKFGPDAILIEGPADADPLTGFVAADGMEPPVALLGYHPDTPAKAAMWPFAVFSPEWQALSYAAENEVRVGFCDLPAAITLAMENEPGDRTDPLALLAEAGGYDDAERWWDAIVESSSDADIFLAVNEAMAALREHADLGTEENPAAASDSAELETDSGESDPPAGDAREPRMDVTVASQRIVVDLHTLRREAYMRQTMRKVLKEGALRLAVVCGAWHAPALEGKLGPAAADARLLKGLPKGKATLTWVPWTHSRLASASGYGAGITSPGWYHHLFTQTEQPIARWLTKVAGTLRAHDLPVSSAHIIESVRLAETLAIMRERPLAGLSEVTEATRAVLCDGDETMLRLVSTELVVGEALGSVPDGAPTVPLEADLRAQLKTLRMKQEALERTVDLDLRTDSGMAKSRLLHRLRLLDIDWGKLTHSQVRNTGTFRETWTLRWRPELAIAIVEAARWGTTLRTAAEARILDAVAYPDATVGQVATALESALLADLGGATDGLIRRLESVAALDHDVTHLLAALPGLLRTLRYGDVRGTDTAALGRVSDGLLVRSCAGLPSAVTGLDADAASDLRALIDAVHLALSARDNEWATATWLSALTALADRADVNGTLVGRAVRLLCDAEIIDAAESARRLSAALSVGHSATDKAAWIDGFLGGRGLLLVHDRNLLSLIDSWLCELAEDQFVATLPLLRRTFGAFDTGEKQAIAQNVRHGAPAAPAQGSTEFDMERGILAMRAAAEILGVA
ncbi:DUF5682 family protein [Nocardia huaxiensis]|uniref:Uncharacterized protein n=1 Tax=Nocardia huaxiensis TaxID=2755382 RepID=A0A7D6ZKI5_9NOCA|nr:DUF5682 family protein [Nocardia huaxiensis]QLY32887.1 hypothetical protein H0264_12135 [Nocardia huaxiensis]UFS93354.1 DUF5682 family protein [Nocardia huaxiensis]